MSYYLLLGSKQYLIALPGNITTGISDTFGKNKTKFVWDSAVCAPEHYPMEILSGTEFYRGEQSFYIRSGGTRNGSWGDGHTTSIDHNKLKLLPDRLKIIFLSYAEKQCYQGEFDLPCEKIQALFREGVINGMVSRTGIVLPNYSKMMVGIAPGGVVAVWAAGRSQTEVFFGQAEKIACNTSLASDENVASELADALSPERLQSLKKEGVPFGLWARYRNKYNWLPNFTAGHSPKDVDVSYLTGENMADWDPAGKNELNKQRAVPSRVSFSTIINGTKIIYIVNLEEFETMVAFDKLGANGKKVFLEFEPRLLRTQIKIRLYNDKESIELKKFVSEDW